MALVREGRLSEARRRFRAGLREAGQGGYRRYEARFLTNLANIAFQLHQYADAMAAYLEARRLARSANDRLVEAALGLNISSVYMATGALDDAVLALDKALAILPADSPPRYAAALLWQRSLLAARLGEWKKAWASYQEGFRIADAAGLADIQADLLDGFGYELFRAGRLPEAETMFVNAFRIRRLHTVSSPPQSYRNLGIMAAASGDLDGALRFLSSAVREALVRPDGTPLWSLYYQRALLHEQAGRLREAMADLDRSLDVIQRLRSEILPVESIRRYSDVRLNDVFQRAVSTAVRLYRATGSERWMRHAFEIAARGQAAGLAASLGEAERVGRRLSPEYWELLQRVAAAETAALAGRRPPDELPQWRHRLGELEIEAGLQFRRTASQPPVTVERLQQALKESDACLLFHVAEPSSYVWALTRESLWMRRLPGRAELRRAVRRFHRAVAGSAPEARTLGAELYELFFGGSPAEERPDWTLLVEDALFELPFAALVRRGPDGSWRYLVEDHALRLVPSAVLLTSPPRRHWRGGFLAVGDPVYNRADPRWKGAGPQKGGIFQLVRTGPDEPELPRLGGAAREIAACLRRWRTSGRRVAALTGPDANRRLLAAALRDRPAVVHFASHVLVPSTGRRSGFVALSLQPDGRLDLLGSTEIRALSCRAELIVLSGCSSGAGEILPGSGLFGLTRAWLRAGARHVVASLWPVRDDAGELWERFYERLGPLGQDGFTVPPHRALQEALASLLGESGKPRPAAQWAGYVLISTG